MSFIRVTGRDATKKKIDVNTTHIVGFSPEDGAGTGADIQLTTGQLLQVNESARQLRSFVRKAQGNLPAKADAEAVSE